MGTSTNSAQRVLALLKAARPRPEKHTAAEVWAHVFGMDAEKVKTDPHDVYTKLLLVRREIDLIGALMQETAIPEPLVKPYLDRVRRVVSPSNLGSQWLGFKQSLPDDTLLCLSYCAALLPEEPEVDRAELQRILDQVQNLRAEIDSTRLSMQVREFLDEQLAIIERAIQEYPIRGAASIKRAFVDGFSDLAARSGDLRSEEDKKEASRVASAWIALGRAGDAIIKGDKIATAYISLMEKGSRATEALSNFFAGQLPPPG